MATAVIMPKQGQSVETCIITKWFKNKGDKVSVGDILFSYETDKAAFDLESPAEGILLDIFFGEGAEVPVLANVAVIGKAGEASTASVQSGRDQTAQYPQASAAMRSPDVQAVKTTVVPRTSCNNLPDHKRSGYLQGQNGWLKDKGIEYQQYSRIRTKRQDY